MQASVALLCWPLLTVLRLCCSLLVCRGYNVGVRLIDEFLCRASGVSCANFRDTASVIAKVAFKMFLGISAEVGRWRPDGRQCVLSFKGNPLLDFVELPQHLAKLEYSNVIAGVIRGACAMIQMHVTVEFVKDELRGQPAHAHDHAHAVSTHSRSSRCPPPPACCSADCAVALSVRGRAAQAPERVRFA